MASLHKTTASSSSSTTLRFLGLLKLPEKFDLNSIELHESDVVWSSETSLSSDSNHSRSNNNNFRHHHKHGLSAALSEDLHPLVRRKPTLSRNIPQVALLRSESSVKFHQSAPVNVPIWQKKKMTESNSPKFLGRFDDDDVEKEDEKEMIPPHEIVARSYVTFSVFEGSGRTLKGRDLRRVRNAVFQKTGFID